MRNATESSLPEILINRTSYHPDGTLEISMLECRELEKGERSPLFLEAGGLLIL